MRHASRVMNARTHLWFAAAALAAVVLLSLALLLSPTGQPAVLTALIAALTVCFASLATHLALARRARVPQAPPETTSESEDAERAAALARREAQLRQRADRLEIREQRLSRRMRVLQLADHERFVDVVDSELSPQAIERLVAHDRELLLLIERRSQQAFEDILANRYAADEGGLAMALVWQDVGDFVETVARLYQPDARHPLLETELELVAKATSSTALHLLLVVDALPLDLKSYNAASMYRTLRRAADYYGTYKQVKPYLDVGLSVLQVARFALGANPVTVGASWVAGKLAAQGAQKVTEQLLHRQVMQLLSDAIRVIAFEVAMVYGGGFRRRDANWFLGAELVNLELARSEDYRGRDQAIRTLCALPLRHEFDRLLLLRQLGSKKPVDMQPALLESLLTVSERQRIVEELREHCKRTDADLGDGPLMDWEAELGARLALATADAEVPPTEDRPRLRGPREWLRRLRSRTAKAPSEEEPPS
ncbi:MAG: hypothetical protein AAF184_19135 [Pseudomonadota bacterium]